MKDESDLELWAAVYDVLGPGWKLIVPEPDMDETCVFITRYLLRCIHENVRDNDEVPNGYEAAWELAACLKHWADKLPETQAVLSAAAAQFTAAYRAGDEAERECLLNGMLEHALESAAVRPYFDSWRRDTMLSGAWRLAMEWAIAHGDPADR